MGAWAPIVYSIIAEQSLGGALLDDLLKGSWIFHLNPLLALNHQSPVLIRPQLNFVVANQISDCLAVDLERWNFNLEFFERHGLNPNDFFENEVGHARQYPTTFWGERCLGVQKILAVGSLHRVGLAGARLTVCKETDIFTVHGRLDECLDLLKYSHLAAALTEDSVKIVVKGVLGSVRTFHLQRKPDRQLLSNRGLLLNRGGLRVIWRGLDSTVDPHGAFEFLNQVEQLLPMLFVLAKIKFHLAHWRLELRDLIAKLVDLLILQGKLLFKNADFVAHCRK